jgi:arginase family enzyme
MGINHITVEGIQHYKKTLIKGACLLLKQRGIKKMHLHLDVDVLHPCVAPANLCAVVNGISKEELFETIELIFEHLLLHH